MAVCSLSTVDGSYIGYATGHFTAAAPYSQASSAIINGDGTARAEFYYSIGGVPLSSVQNANYTVTDAADGSGNCKLAFSALLLGILPVSFEAFTDALGKKMYTVTTTPGVTFYGYLERNP